MGFFSGNIANAFVYAIVRGQIEQEQDATEKIDSTDTTLTICSSGSKLERSLLL
jgi:hypothetical protein